MKKTHKRILGFVGLSFVAAVTAVAAVMPTPMASAVSSVVDNITVYVSHNGPELELSTDYGETVTDPNYSFRISYNRVSNITVTLKNISDAGEIQFNNKIWEKYTDGGRGTDTVNINLHDLGGYGNFTIKVVGLGEGDVPIERILTVKYTEIPPDVPGEGDEEPKVDIPDGDIPEEVVETAIYTLFAEDKQTVIKEFDPVQNPSGTITLDIESLHLSEGVYWLQTVSKNQHGDILKTSWERILVDKNEDGGDIPVEVEDVGEEISKVVITVTNSDGIQVMDTITANNPQPGDIINVNIPPNLPAGVYTITTKYYDTNNQVIKTVIEHFIKTDSSEKIEFPAEERVDTVTTIETEIYNDKNEVVRILKADRETGVMEVYDKNGNLIFTVPGGYKNGKLTIPMAGLDSGDYIGIISYKNQYGHLVGNTKRIRIHWNAGKAIIVPDTGGFLQGLNISREDYLITGAVVFAIIGIVAFGVVKNRRNRR